MDKITEKFLKWSNTPCDINEHLPTLKNLSEQCDSVVELGIGRVVSTWGLLAGFPKRMISVDINDPIIHGQPIQEVFDACKEKNINYNFILNDSSKIEIEECDLLFIDTWHVYDHLKKELTLHGNKAKKYIAFHDTVTFGTYGETHGHLGLNKAIEEFLAENPHWKIQAFYKNNNGLTVLQRTQ